MKLFLAVIFACVSNGDNCGFLYVPQPFSDQQKCLASIQAEMKNLEKNYPMAQVHGSCLLVELKAA